MRDKPVIVGALATFLVGLTFPLWYSLAAGDRGEPPVMERPAGGRCVEDAAHMKTHHMRLLNQWRDAVVRDGQTTYVSKTFGESHRMSLTGTCMACHANRRTFCDQCHAYANVSAALACWDCHLDPSDF